jgi:hypothetical protein
MSGVILATAIGGTAVGTGALVAAGIGAGTTLYGGAKSFSNANKARKRGEAAERAADKAIEEARRRVDVNAYEQLSIAKEPYELMRDALLTAGATGLQTGVEGETRGAAATAGRIQMAQNLKEGEVRADMGQQMDELNRLVADEDKRRQQQLAGIAMEETAGAQLAVRDAEEDRANYIAQGVGTLGSIAEGLSSSYAEGNFGSSRQYTPEGRANTAATIRSGDLGQGMGYELADGSVLNPNIDPDAFAAFGGTVPTGMEANAQVRQGRRAERQLAREDRRIANDIQRAQAQAAIDPAFGGPVIAQDRTFNPNFSPLGTSARPDQYTAPGQAMSPRQTERMLMAQRRLGQQEARDIQRAIRRNPELLRAQSDPYDPFGGRNFTPPSSDNATQGEARASVAPAGVGGPVAPAPERERIDSEVMRSIEVASQGMRGGMSNPQFTSQPTAQEVEKVNTEAVEKAEEVGPAAAEVVRGATENVTSSNPLPIAMQWLNVREPNYRELDPVTGDSVYVNTPTITPEGEALLTEVWAGVGHSEKTRKDYIKKENAWCAGFVNKVLADSNLTPLGGKLSKQRADMYMAEKFGENVFTSEKVNRLNLHGNLKKFSDDYGFPSVKGNVKDAKMGDVVIINRPKKDQPDTRHVAFFAGFDNEGKIKLLGGNQNDEVNVSSYDVADVIGIRRVNQPDLSDKELEAVSKIVVKGDGATR